ncbi:YdeI/OmpD-associated family protein [Branchiibius sp. NY16-3462-2]|uniref:YdeI/OmpD-associated family protein n=1 Tax=Branchiibius sp. NY16-3462-2 TaxID=1807500 RepID=UPI000798583C|nr:YdeI/OmpD-associated family protein [Branchiibius sp. NY16-3462-2]KYH44529.1 2-isopropylmalate synthase [Branchiibius sp. NY16-3462-2]
MSSLKLSTELVARGPAAAIVLTDDQVAGLSSKKVFPVTVTIGDRSFAGRVARMGGENLVGLSKAAREQLQVQVGQHVEVTLSPDDAPRTVELPPELAAALDQDPAARAAFDALSMSRQKELARTVAEAKKPETRARRLEAALASLVTPSAR